MKRIFVLGKDRSGTKWLSNIILNSDKVKGIQSEYHRGIVETNLFEVFPSIFGTLNRIDNYIAFVETFTSGDFFRLTGLEKKLLYENRFKDYLTVFEFVMDAFTRKEGGKAWLQKAHILNFFKLKKKFPDANFIIIERAFLDNVKSAINFQKKIGIKGSLTREVLLYILSKKARKKIIRKFPVFFIKYSDIKNKNIELLIKIFEFAGIEFKECFLDVSYRKNTSFSNREEKERYGKWFDVKSLFLYYLFSCIPFKIMILFYALYRKCFSKTSIIGGSFSLISDEFSLEKVEY